MTVHHDRVTSAWALVAAGAVGAIFGLVASFIGLVMGVHGPVLPAAFIDGPLILLYSGGDAGYVITVLGGGVALYAAYGCLIVRPPQFLGRFGVVLVAVLIHAASAAVVLRM